jgi:hypothetical protein
MIWRLTYGFGGTIRSPTLMTRSQTLALRGGGTIFEVVPIVDSLGVVTALLTIEKHVKFVVPPRIIKAGGYGSFEEMLAHLLPRVRALAIQRRKKEAA